MQNKHKYSKIKIKQKEKENQRDLYFIIKEPKVQSI